MALLSGHPKPRYFLNTSHKQRRCPGRWNWAFLSRLKTNKEGFQKLSFEALRRPLSLYQGGDLLLSVVHQWNISPLSMSFFSLKAKPRFVVFSFFLFVLPKFLRLPRFPLIRSYKRPQDGKNGVSFDRIIPRIRAWFNCIGKNDWKF